MNTTKRIRLVFFALGLATLAAVVSARGLDSNEKWVGTWATAVVARGQGPQTLPRGFGPPPRAGGNNGAAPAATGGPPRRSLFGPPLSFDDQTMRQIVHVSIGGEQIRVLLSNAFGTEPLQIGAAHVALRDKDANIVAKTARTLTFSGRAASTIAPGAVLLSDPVQLKVPALADLAIDLYLPGNSQSPAMTLTTHGGAQQTNYVSTAGNHSGAAEFPVKEKLGSWYFLSSVEVAASSKAGAVVTFGDSITDGTRSTVDANHRWPDFLAKRLVAAKLPIGVLNQGIAGNQVLNDGAGVSALARFDRDALMQTGVTHVIVLESINDIGIARSNPSPSAEDLIAGHRQLIARAHARGLKIFGATLTPFVGAAYASPEGEAKRQAINEWIRTGKEYDGVVDFDKAVRDPNDPSKLRAEFNPGDNLHMNDAGYEAMANAIDLKLFER